LRISLISAELHYLNRSEKSRKAQLLKISREYTSSTVDLKNENVFKIISKVSNLYDYLNVEFGRKITSADLEKKFSTNFDYINRRFQSTYGCTIFKYITKLRINKAKELIQTTDLNFSEISYLVGIGDPYYFSKLFKKQTGFTPSEYLMVSNKKWSETIKVQKAHAPKSDKI
jgi:YesN/AraC family two-component response regulator